MTDAAQTCSVCGRKIVYDWNKESWTLVPNGVLVLRYSPPGNSETFWLCNEHKESRVPA